jgi:hypothetical protein
VLAGRFQLGGHAEARDVEAQVPPEPRLVAEDQRSHPGVQAVGTHHEVEGAGLRVVERDLHAVGGFGQRGDPVAEDVLGVLVGPVVQDAGEVAAQDLDLATGELRGQRHPRPTGGIHHHPLGPPGLLAAHLVEDAHPAHNGQVRLAAQVDGLPAFAQRGGALDDGRLEAVAAQPVRQRRSGDARPGDEDLRVLHRCSLLGPCLDGSRASATALTARWPPADG